MAAALFTLLHLSFLLLTSSYQRLSLKPTLKVQPITRDYTHSQVSKAISLCKWSPCPLITCSNWKGWKCHNPSHPKLFYFITYHSFLAKKKKKVSLKRQFHEVKRDFGCESQGLNKQIWTAASKCGRNATTEEEGIILPGWHFIPKALSELPGSGTPATGTAFRHDSIYSGMSSKVHHAHNFIRRSVNYSDLLMRDNKSHFPACT